MIYNHSVNGVGNNIIKKAGKKPNKENIFMLKIETKSKILISKVTIELKNIIVIVNRKRIEMKNRKEKQISIVNQLENQKKRNRQAFKSQNAKKSNKIFD